MMNKIKLLTVGFILVLAVTSTANASVYGFENGLQSWTMGSNTDPANVAIVSSATAYNGGNYTPTEEAGILKLTAGTPFVGTGKQTELSKYIGDLFAGDVLSFDWAFLGKDYLPYNDFVGFSLTSQMGIVVSQVLSSISAVSNYGDTGWQSFVFELPLDIIDVEIMFYAQNDKDGILSSELLVDNIRFSTIPEPVTLILLCSGLIGMGLSMKQKNIGGKIGS